MSQLRRRRIKTVKQRYAESREEILSKIFCDEPPRDDEINIEEPYQRSTFTLREYVTLDYEHKRDIDRMKRTISHYAKDITRKRPLNIVMIAQPGSGKSHIIRCLAAAMGQLNVSAVTFNMANLVNIDDLIQPLDAVRNLKVADRIPILFLDEFDIQTRNYSLLLPLLWDGELHIGHRDLKLGKVVIVLAGSDLGIKKTIKKARSMQKESEREEPEGEEKKLVDLLSRINGGVFEIPELELVSKSRDRRVDKVCIGLSLLQQRFGGDLELAPWSLLHFIAVNKFRYEIRSIAHLIELIPAEAFSSNHLDPEMIDLPLDSLKDLEKSSLAYHLVAHDEPEEIIETWERVSTIERLVRFQSAPEEEL